MPIISNLRLTCLKSGVICTILGDENVKLLDYIIYRHVNFKNSAALLS